MPARLRLPILRDRDKSAYQAESGANIPGVVSMVVRWKQRQPWLPRSSLPAGKDPIWPIPPDLGSRLCGLHEEGPRVAAGEAWGR